MADHFCDRCGEYLPEGSMRYTVHVQILSDFDGFVFFEGESAPDDSPGFCSDDDCVDTAELEEDLFQELTFVLCGKCKRRFARDPFNRGLGLSSAGKRMERLFH